MPKACVGAMEGGAVTWRRAERAAQQEPPTCFGDSAAEKSGFERIFPHDGGPNPGADGGLFLLYQFPSFAGGAEKGRNMHRRTARHRIRKARRESGKESAYRRKRIEKTAGRFPIDRNVSVKI